MRGRLYRRIRVEDVQPGDVAIFIECGTYTRVVKKVAKVTIHVAQPKGIMPRTKRVSRKNITEVWRWHKKA